MNFSNILSEIERLDPEVYERTSQRRDVIKNMTRKVGLAALPFAIGAMFNKAYGKNTDLITDTLNFALTLEYLEAEFYQKGLTAATLTIPTSAARDALQTIANHEAAHVIFLKAAVTAAGGKPVEKPTFDFSAGNSASMNGPFATVFSDYNLFLAVAQTFEDTGVRAYKGQAANLATSNDYLQAALQIHSVEARHAAHIRSMRRAAGGPLVVGTPKPWITGKNSNINSPAVQASYDGEENTLQATVQILSLGGTSMDAATESFDEPLTKDQVLAIVDPFII